MNLLLSTPGLDSKVHKAVERHLHHVMPHIKKRLGRHDDTPRTLRARLTTDNKFSSANLYHLTLSIQLPDHPVVVHKTGTDLHALIADGEVAIKKELRRSVAKLRAEYLQRKRMIERRNFRDFAEDLYDEPSLSQSADNPPSVANQLEAHPLFARLRPILGHLHNYAQEHLNSTVAAGELPENALDADDLVDQAILSMMESDKNLMTDPVILERALFQEIDVILEKEIKASAERPTISLEERAPFQEQWGTSAPEVEESEFNRPYEALKMEDILVDEDLSHEANPLTEKEEYRMILKNLGGFHKKARSAFFLNKIEGFELFEIAMIQNRKETEVQEDIVKCVQHLKESWADLHKRFAERAEAV